MSFWHQLLPGFIYDCHYETLVNDQINESKRLLAFCGIDWHEDCEHFYNNNRPVMTASNVQVRQPIYKSSIGKWKHYEKQLAPLIEALDDNLL